MSAKRLGGGGTTERGPGGLALFSIGDSDGAGNTAYISAGSPAMAPLRSGAGYFTISAQETFGTRAFHDSAPAKRRDVDGIQV